MKKWSLLVALVSLCACFPFRSKVSQPKPPKKAAAVEEEFAALNAAGVSRTITPLPPQVTGLVCNDTSPHPMTSQAKPARLATYVDQDLGGTVRRITEAPLSWGSNAAIVPMYSTVPAWNADESYLLLYTKGCVQGSCGTHLLYNGKTYAFIKKIDVPASDVEHLVWDQTDPDIFYYPSTYPGNTNSPQGLYRFHVSTDGPPHPGAPSGDLVRDFTNVGCNTANPISFGHAAYMSWDKNNQVMGFQCASQGHEDTGNPVRFIYNMTTNKVLARIFYRCGVAPNPPCNGLAWASGADGLTGEFLGSVYDNTFHFLRSLGLVSNAEHNCQGKAVNGNNAWYGVVFDPGNQSGSMVEVDEATGIQRVVIGPATGYPSPPSLTHNTAVAFQKPFRHAMSVVGSAPWGQRILESEIVYADLGQGPGGTDIICRVAHHRSEAGNAPGCSPPYGACWGYFGEPHVTISPIGTRLLFGSDWLVGASVDTYVVELPDYVP